MKRLFMFSGLLATWLWVGAAEATAVTVDIALDTTALRGTSGVLAFDLIPGDGVNSNTVSLRDFATDGTLNAATASGDVIGGVSPILAVVGEGQFLNDLMLEMTLGTFVRARLDVTTNGPAVPFPDEVSVFALDADKVPLATNDPTGADALLVIDLTAAGPRLRVFASSVTPLRAASCRTDTDLNGTLDVATDLTYSARHLLGLAPVPPSFRMLDPAIVSDVVIVAGMETMGMALDVDNNAVVEVSTDMVYIARHLLGLPPVPAAFRRLDPNIPTDQAIAVTIDALCSRM